MKNTKKHNLRRKQPQKYYVGTKNQTQNSSKIGEQTTEVTVRHNKKGLKKNESKQHNTTQQQKRSTTLNNSNQLSTTNNSRSSNNTATCTLKTNQSFQKSMDTASECQSTMSYRKRNFLYIWWAKLSAFSNNKNNKQSSFSEAESTVGIMIIPSAQLCIQSD